MLKKAAVENILAAALESGADFAEIYAERTKRSSIAMAVFRESGDLRLYE